MTTHTPLTPDLAAARTRFWTITTRIVTRECRVCGDVFTVEPTSTRRQTCSEACRVELWRESMQAKQEAA